MAFREKLAWLTLLSMLLAYPVYFGLLEGGAVPGLSPLLRIIILFGAVSLVQAIVVIAVSAVMAVRARRDAASRADERDRAIERRGATAGYYVLMVGVICSGVVMPFFAPRSDLINATLLAVVVAELVRLTIIIRSYRLGWHG